MKIAFVTPSLSRAAGGIFQAERALAQALHRETPTDVEVLGLEDEHTMADLPAWRPLRPQVFSTRGPRAFAYAPELPEALFATSADLVHLHALWMYPSVASLRHRRRYDTPTIISPHGMLDPWAVRNSAWKKKAAGYLFEHAHLRGAACLHALNSEEARAIRDYGLSNPIAIIPNGVNLPPDDGPKTAPWRSQIDANQRVLLFLGRLHPKKGLANLIDAWAESAARTAGWSLAIVGWDDGGHEAVLRERIQPHGLTDVHLLGPMFGPDKAAAFHHADAFTLPSFSEGLPMAVLEAWSYRLPVLMTPGCNLKIGFERQAALHIEPTAASIQNGLEELFALPEGERQAIGQRGRVLVEDRFTWAQVAQKMHAVYRWVLGDGSRPAFVVS